MQVRFMQPMQEQPYHDFHLLHIYLHVYGVKKTTAQSRDVQQKLGPLISRINKKLKQEKKKIVPGNMKRTYRLVDIEG